MNEKKYANESNEREWNDLKRRKFFDVPSVSICLKAKKFVVFKMKKKTYVYLHAVAEM